MQKFCNTDNYIKNSTNLVFNTGLDCIFVQAQKLPYLAKYRFLKEKYKHLGKSGFNLRDNRVDPLDKREILKIAKKTALILIFKTDWVQFRNETSYLKDSLKFKTPLLKSNRSLSITQKIFLYSIAKEYTIESEEYLPVDIMEWKNHSWTIAALQMLKGTSQAKIATFLGKSREYVNKKLKHSSHNLYVCNEFLTMTDSIVSNGKDIKRLKVRLNQGNLRGYKLNHEGKLVRQLPNSYKLKGKHKGALLFRKNTFYYSNKTLNKSFFSKQDSQNCGTAKKRVTHIKRISLFRAFKRGNAHAKIFGVKGNKDMNACKAVERYYKDLEFTFKSKFKKKEITNVKTGLINLNQKLKREVETLRKLELKASSDVKSLGQISRLDRKAPLFPLKGASFKKATCRNFHKDLKVTSDFTNSTKTNALYWHLKIRQRQFLEFMGKHYNSAA